MKLSNLELVELRQLLNNEVHELQHLKFNNWAPEKSDYDLVKPKMLEIIASKLFIPSTSKEAEDVWNFIKYGTY